MPIDRERERAVREGVEQVRRMLDDPAHEYADDDDDVRCENLAEVIALLVAQARDAGSDETLLVEIMLRVTGSHRDTLLEAKQVLQAVGYDKIARLLERLARSAPRRLTWKERMKISAAERREARATRH
jgi:hypothetical protein